MDTDNQSLMDNGSLFLPESLSTFSQDVDFLFYAIFVLSIVLSIMMFGVMFYFLFKYRRTKMNQKAAKQVIDNHMLEFLWSFIPLVIVMVIFFWGWKDYLILSIAPENAMEIRVTGQKWYWSFYYPQTGAESTTDLYVPVGEPVKLVMSSKDVLHSVFIPNFRVKKDVVPNYYTNLWFEATEVGSYQLFCAEYCGDAHSTMLGNVHVLSRSDFDQKMKELSFGDDLPLDVLGAKLYKKHGCFGCHSVDGSVVVGPSWKGLYGSARQFSDGASIEADDNYLRESIVNPAKRIVNGYSNVMNSYAGLLEDREMDAIIEYIKTLK